MNRYYTSIEESKKLIELGLKAETADMFWSQHNCYSIPWIWDRCKLIKTDIPCWSVGQLLELMPKIKGSKCPKLLKFIKNDKQFYVVSYKRISYTGFYKTPIEACYETMCWLLENNYIKTK